MTSFMQECFSGFGYVLLHANEAPTSAVTNYGESWHQKYFEEEFFKIDPAFHFSGLCGNRSGVQLLDESQMISPLFEEARIYGADSNFNSVSHFAGSKMVFGGVNHDLDARKIDDLQKSCRQSHRILLAQKMHELSDAQIDFLELAEEAMAEKQIASELGISVSAVAQRKRVLCSRVGVSNFGAVVSLYSSWKWGDIVGN